MSLARFVILPGDNRYNYQMHTASLDFFRAAGGAGGGMAAAGAIAAAPQPEFGRVLKRLGDNDAWLVAIDDATRLSLQRKFPGLRVVEEGSARMASMQRALLPIATGGMAATARSLKEFVVTVTNPQGKPLKGVLVSAITDVSTNPPTGAQTKTDARGRARLQLPAKTKIVRVIAEDVPRHWSSSWSSVIAKRPSKLTVVCKPIDPVAPDGLRRMHAAGAEDDGDGVTVAVIDGGASHRALRIDSGANFCDDEDAANFKDNGIGHGTHVAGIIAARGGGGTPGGLAPGVRLLVYRVFTKGSRTTGSFAVSEAIHKAVDEGADLINLSLTLTGDVTHTERAIRRARSKGVVCVAAAGNSADAVQFPARFSSVVGVSAIGVRNGWPKEAHEFDVRKSPRAKGHPKIGVATFSCHGPEIDFAAPGVGVVSLVPRDSYAAMNGTSMAAPAITALVARKLARDPALLRAGRDQARSDAILSMAAEVASSVGLPAHYQGHGVLG